MAGSSMGGGRILLLLAVICFVLAALGVDLVPEINTFYVGMALFAGSFLVR